MEDAAGSESTDFVRLVFAAGDFLRRMRERAQAVAPL
jgi:hypothetical protein